MLCLAVVVWLSVNIGVVKQPNRSDVIGDHSNWLAKDLSNMIYLIVRIIKDTYTLHSLVAPQSWTKPFKFKV